MAEVSVKLHLTLVQRSIFLNAAMEVAFPNRMRLVQHLVVDLIIPPAYDAYPISGGIQFPGELLLSTEGHTG